MVIYGDGGEVRLAPVGRSPYPCNTDMQKLFLCSTLKDYL